MNPALHPSYVARTNNHGGRHGKDFERDRDTVKDYGPVEDRFTELDGYTVNFVTIREAQDLAPMLASLPAGRCELPALGLPGQRPDDWCSTRPATPR